MKSSVPKILWGMILAYILVFGVFTAVRHYQFQTQAWDMGIFDQLFWNTTHGQFMQSSLEEIPNHFGIHFSPTLLLLIPGYALFPSPHYLLFMQTIALALGAWPLYLIARKKLKDPFPLIIAGAYLLYPSLHWVNTFDFHEIAFFIPLAIAGFYFLEERKILLASVFLILAAGTKEDAILMVLCIGLYKLIESFLKKDRLGKITGASIAVIALIYFLVTIKIIMPFFGGGLLRLDRYSELGGSVREIILNSAVNPTLPLSLLLQPDKLIYSFWLFLPLAFLPLFSWSSLVLILPGILENTLTNNKFQFSGLYQYDAVVIPGTFIGMILGIRFMLKRFPDIRSDITWKIILVASLSAFLVRSPLSPFNFPRDLFTSSSRWDSLRYLVNKVPDNVSVATMTYLVPHLTNREKIYILGMEYGRQVDYIVIDGKDLSGFANEELFQSYADHYMLSGNYTYEEIQNRYFILKRKDL